MSILSILINFHLYLPIIKIRIDFLLYSFTIHSIKIYANNVYYFLSLFAIYNNLLPSLSGFTTELCSHILGRQFIRIYHQSLEAIGQAVTDAAFFILYFDSAVTIAHFVLISLLGSVYYSCSQHLHRTGSSYQYIKTDLALIKIFVILVLYLGVLVTISVIFLYCHVTQT